MAVLLKCVNKYTPSAGKGKEWRMYRQNRKRLRVGPARQVADFGGTAVALPLARGPEDKPDHLQVSPRGLFYCKCSIYICLDRILISTQ